MPRELRFIKDGEATLEYWFGISCKLEKALVDFNLLPVASKFDNNYKEYVVPLEGKGMTLDKALMLLERLEEEFGLIGFSYSILTDKERGLSPHIHYYFD